MSSVQAIAGVSIDRESEIDTVYPSIAASTLGKVIGQIMDVPAPLGNTVLRLAALCLLGLITSPFAVIAYFVGKLTGNCYVITNRRVHPRSILGKKSGTGPTIQQIADVQITEKPGYRFYRVGDVSLRDPSGKTLLVIPATPHPERLRHMIRELCFSQEQSGSALAQIEARQRPA